MNLAIDITTHDARTAIMTVTGQLTAMSASNFRDAMTRTIDQRQNHLLLDLTGVDFIDSSGLGAVISGLKTARQAGGDLRIVGAGPQVIMILELTSLHQILPIYESVAAAVPDASA